VEREELHRLLRQRPFQPFRLLLRDGRAFEVRYPEMNLLARSYVKIGIPDLEGPRPVCDHTEFVLLSQIAGAEPLPPTASPSPP
jgi:hypothetical protein